MVVIHSYVKLPEWGIIPLVQADDAEVYHLPAVEVFEVYALRAGADARWLRMRQRSQLVWQSRSLYIYII